MAKYKYVGNKRADDGTSTIVLEDGTSLAVGDVGEMKAAERDSLQEFFVLEAVDKSDSDKSESDSDKE